MKPKPLHGSRGRLTRGKAVKKEIVAQNVLVSGHPHEIERPSVEITKCISFQKFRYSGENRPGKKYQEKDFMELKLSNLEDRVVRVVIICTDADNKELIHPNGLVGKDCCDGIYDREYVINKNVQDIKIPYLRTERIKTKKNESDNIQTILETRARHLPSPYKERCLSQCNDKYTSARKFDTTKICLGVIVTIVSHQGTFNGSLHAISHVVRNASEKTTLGIHKLSPPFVSASEGGLIDIFTTESGPEIEEGKYLVFVTYEDDKYGQWTSETCATRKSDILYKRIISYHVPPFALCDDLPSSVTATLNLECPQSNQYCSCPFTYKPHHEFIQSEPFITNQLKRCLSGQENLNLSPKTMRLDDEAYDQRKTIKAHLQSKLRAKQDGFFEVAKDGNNGDMVVHESKDISEAPQLVLSRGDQSAGESPFYMDLDRHQHQSQNALSIIGNQGGKGEGAQGNASSSDGHQSIEVVATGYSDEVPPDTTVLIYTTTGGITADNLSEAVHENQVILQELPQRPNQLSEQVIDYMKDAKKASYPPFTSHGTTTEFSSQHTNVSQIQVVASTADDVISQTARSILPTASVNSPSTAPTSNNVKRQVIAPSRVQHTYAWEVASDDDNLAAVLFPVKRNKNDQIKESHEGKTRVVYDHSNARGLSIKPVAGRSLPSLLSVQTIASNLHNDTNPVDNPNVMNFLNSMNIQEVSSMTTMDLTDMVLKMQNGSVLNSSDTDVKPASPSKDEK